MRKFLSIITLLTAILGFSAIPVVAQPDDMSDEEVLEIFHRGVRLVEKTAHGRFILAGEVVDQEESRLSEVEVLLRMDSLKGWGWDVESSYEKKMLMNGRFSIDVRPYAGVTARFRKNGYYDETLDFNFKMDVDPRIEEAIMEGEDMEVEEGVVRHENIRVVLEKVGDITQLLPYGGPLEFIAPYERETAGAVVIDFSESPVPYRQKPLKRIEDIGDAESLPPGCLYIVADTDDEGRILTETIIGGEWNQHKRDYPQRIRLRINDPDGGFVVYEQEQEKHASWSMKRAPDNGYEPELILTADWLHEKSQVSPSSGTFFYFKTGERYGKGTIGEVNLQNGNTRLIVYGGGNLQPDGTRNVDTGRR